MNYNSSSKNRISIENEEIKPDGFTSIRLTNIGQDDVKVNDNIPLNVGGVFTWFNEPYVKIDENIKIKFADLNANKQILIEFFYYNITNN